MADFIGTEGNDYIYSGPVTDDIYDLLGGDDTVRIEYGGNDTYNTGTGNDWIRDVAGDDVYIFNTGDGQDLVYDYNGSDTIRFGDGITKTNTVFSKVGNDVVISIQGTTDSITVKDWYLVDSYEHKIESIQFNNGTSYTKAEIEQIIDGILIIGTDNNDSLVGNDLDNTMIGNLGNDAYTGGIGNDTVIDESGDEVYNFNSGDGQDIISDLNGSDVVKFGTGIVKEDLEFAQDGDNLVISLKNSTDKITVSNWYADDTNQIEKFEFADGTYITNDDINEPPTPAVPEIKGTNCNDALYGTADSEVILGLAGNDYIRDYGGNDTIRGGIGNDHIQDYAGNDLINAGNGDDCIQDYTGDDTLRGGAGNDGIQDYTGNDLINGGAGNDWIRDYAGNDTLRGGIGNDYIQDYTGNDIINAGDGDDGIEDYTGNDLLKGGTGNDGIYDYAGNDTIIGGAGKDYIVDYAGNDTYIFNSGDGKDLLCDKSNNKQEVDTLIFGSNVSKQDIAMFRKGSDLIISYGAGDEVTISHQFSCQKGIEVFQLGNEFLTDTDVNKIIQDIASYDKANKCVSINSISDVQSNDHLMNLIAGSWQS